MNKITIKTTLAKIKSQSVGKYQAIDSKIYIFIELEEKYIYIFYKTNKNYVLLRLNIHNPNTLNIGKRSRWNIKITTNIITILFFHSRAKIK